MREQLKTGHVTCSQAFSAERPCHAVVIGPG